MRTTVDLPFVVHARVRRLAQARGTSVSSVLADLTARGLREVEGEPGLPTDPSTGLPVLDFGQPLTAAEIDDFLDEVE